jgi:hypothetical protein
LLVVGNWDERCHIEEPRLAFVTRAIAEEGGQANQANPTANSKVTVSYDPQFLTRVTRRSTSRPGGMVNSKNERQATLPRQNQTYCGRSRTSRSKAKKANKSYNHYGEHSVLYASDSGVSIRGEDAFVGRRNTKINIRILLPSFDLAYTSPGRRIGKVRMSSEL